MLFPGQYLIDGYAKKYLTVLDEVAGILFAGTGGQNPCFRVKVVCIDLLQFNFILYLEYNCGIRSSKCDCKLAVATYSRIFMD